MKIQCDVCCSNEAAVFCTAEEAALCDGCDKKVHHANNLANNHLRYSLLSPNSSQFCNNNYHTPLCDICQDRRAFLFCREDRAIVCGECDIVIHKANEYTKNHNRFLLSGIKLSALSSPYPYPYPNSCPSSSNSSDPYLNRTTSDTVSTSYNHDINSQYSYTSNDDVTMMMNYNQINQDCSPMEKTLHVWRLEDLLLPSSISRQDPL